MKNKELLKEIKKLFINVDSIINLSNEGIYNEIKEYSDAKKYIYSLLYDILEGYDLLYTFNIKGLVDLAKDELQNMIHTNNLKYLVKYKTEYMQIENKKELDEFISNNNCDIEEIEIYAYIKKFKPQLTSELIEVEVK
jgi:hypothetical protein